MVTFNAASVAAILVSLMPKSSGFTAIQTGKVSNSALFSTNFDKSNKESLPTRRQTIELAIGALGLGTSLKFIIHKPLKVTDYSFEEIFEKTETIITKHIKIK